MLSAETFSIQEFRHKTAIGGEAVEWPPTQDHILGRLQLPARSGAIPEATFKIPRGEVKYYTYIVYYTNQLCGAEHHSRGHKLCSHSVVPRIL
jgi:hypothetical protein